ncbi:hypothetical protein ACUNFS_02975 [Serratia sp. IR-2025]
MGYFNNQTGYPTDILSTRAIIKRGNYALIPPNGCSAAKFFGLIGGEFWTV